MPLPWALWAGPGGSPDVRGAFPRGRILDASCLINKDTFRAYLHSFGVEDPSWIVRQLQRGSLGCSLPQLCCCLPVMGGPSQDRREAARAPAYPHGLYQVPTATAKAPTDTELAAQPQQPREASGESEHAWLVSTCMTWRPRLGPNGSLAFRLNLSMC